jgi:type VI secretion system secreted protein Hcp
MDNARPDHDALETELADLRRRLKTQGDELDALRAQLAPASGPTRRDLLRAGGLVGAGLAALTVAGVAGATPQPALAIEGQNLRLRGGFLIYLTLKGQKQGDIKGGVLQKGREGAIAVQYLQSKIVSPRDAASGLPTGKRQHEPLVFRKAIDKSTPKLLDAMVNNENLTAATFKFYRTSTTGVEQEYFNIKLTNASLASTNLYHPDTMDSTAPAATNNGSGGGAELEEFTLTYQKIEWIYLDGGISAQDDWQSPSP